MVNNSNKKILYNILYIPLFKFYFLSRKNLYEIKFY